MEKREILNDYKKQEDKILLAKVLDKIDIADKRNTVETTDFLDMYQISLVESFFKKISFKDYIFYGGYEQAERKVLIVYSQKYDESMIDKNKQSKIEIVRIDLPEQEKGSLSHRNYLGAIIKIGVKREKVGDILVRPEGADIIVIRDIAGTLERELPLLTRFSNSKIYIEDIKNLKKQEVKIEEITIIVPSLRLDNFVSDLARTSRSKAVQIINQERVFINGQNEIKVSKQVKLNDVITIRGKGRFIIKDFTGTTKSGRYVVKIEKYV